MKRKGMADLRTELDSGAWEVQPDKGYHKQISTLLPHSVHHVSWIKEMNRDHLQETSLGRPLIPWDSCMIPREVERTPPPKKMMEVSLLANFDM